MIFGISGKMGSGKDTVGKIIYDMLKPNCKITHFADPLKDLCINYLGLSYDDVYTENGKKQFNDFWKMTNREILQKVGTDAFRNGFDKDVWVKITELNILSKHDCNYIIPDIRFDNEAEMVIKHGGIVLNIERNNWNKNSHISEQGISKKLITVNIENNGTIENLKEKIFKVIEK